jgi:hypothetical protein
MAQRAFLDCVEEAPARLYVLLRADRLDAQARGIRLRDQRSCGTRAVATDDLRAVPRVKFDKPRDDPAGTGTMVDDLNVYQSVRTAAGGGYGR